MTRHDTAREILPDGVIDVDADDTSTLLLRFQSGTKGGSGPGSMAAAVNRAATLFGGLHGLAVAAGPMLARTPFVDTSDDDWEDYFQNQLMLTVRA